ncbi:hypothetical protein BDA96_08G008900 [Sorghum bicolor]|uniref:Uncharacterized protein n=1 Tax=Sorghum bicolor TaxID=4558 RepID=A0A921QFQ0_SORBI|nr:hypothetical protein BDA96_08G008900 [Sorghum bicolor]
MMILPVERRIEAYDGENDDLDNFEALLSVPEDSPFLQRVIEVEPIAAATQVLVEQNENQLGPNDLQACLRQGEWNRVLDILTQMVLDGKAAATAVGNDPHPLDIRRTHPELVVLLRGQALFDLRGMGNAIRADAYYRDNIRAIYPDDSSTGIEFVDKLLAEIKVMVRGEQLPRKCRFNDKDKTRQSVNDYLKIYFPTFRDVEIKDGVVPIGLFGEKKGKEVRCLACHDFKKKKYSERKLYYHQLQDPAGRQALCPASTEYIRKKIHDVLAKKEAAEDGAQGP